MDGGDPEAGLKADAAAVTLAQLGTNGGNNAGVHGSHAASVTARPASCFPSHASTRSHRRRDPNGVSVQPAHAPPQGPATGS
jgi:hypothetical protein